MTEDAEINSLFGTIPNEILNNIFFFLPAKDLMNFRRVCNRWRSIIDRVASKDSLWQMFCERDFKNYCWIAKQKASRDITWYYLYRSLCLWPKLAYADEDNDEFASASRIAEEVRSVEVLGNGILGVHKKNVIQYYNSTTFRIAPQKPINGDYARYAENECAIVIQNYHLHVFVIRKILNKKDDEVNTTFDNVKIFYLVGSQLYFVKLNDEIYVCNICSGQKIMHKFIECTGDQDGVLSLGYSNNRLNILTYQRNIYSIVNNNKMVLQQSLTKESNILNVLYQYNILDQLDWRVYFQWMYVFHHSVPEGPMRNIVIIRSFGDLFFVGTNSGVLTIYYHPFINGELNLFQCEPIKQINFMERLDIPVLATCPILQIDIMETKSGHTVFVAMPKKVAVLRYTYDFLCPINWSITTYSDVQQAQYLNSEISN